MCSRVWVNVTNKHIDLRYQPFMVWVQFKDTVILCLCGFIWKWDECFLHKAPDLKITKEMCLGSTVGLWKLKERKWRHFDLIGHICCGHGSLQKFKVDKEEKYVTGATLFSTSVCQQIEWQTTYKCVQNVLLCYLCNKFAWLNKSPVFKVTLGKTRVCWNH